MENETLPIQLAKEISKDLFIKNKKVETKEVLDEFEKVLGNDFLKIINEIKEFERKEKENERISKQEDLEEEINLFEEQEEELKKEEKGKQKYNKSKNEFDLKLKEQNEFINLFNKEKEKDKFNFQFKESINIIKNEDFPSKEDIEKDREDKNEYLSSDPLIQQSLSYMNKFKNYFKKIKEIKDIKQIPTNIEISIILENFKKYLNDSRYFINFFNKYKSFWSKESNKFIQNYKELYIPIEKRKEIFNINESSLNDFIPLRNKIYNQFYNNQILDDSNLPELALYYSKLSFIPSMTKEELNNLYFQSFKELDYFDENKNENTELDLKLSLESGLDSGLNSDLKMNYRLNDTKIDDQSKENLKEYLKRSHFLKGMNNFSINYFENEKLNTITIDEFLNEINKLKVILSEIKNGIHSIWILHGKNNFTYHYLLFICLSIELNIPCILFNSNEMKYLPNNLTNDLIVTCKFNFKKNDLNPLNNTIYYYGLEDSNEIKNWDLNLSSSPFKLFKSEMKRRMEFTNQTNKMNKNENKIIQFEKEEFINLKFKTIIKKLELLILPSKKIFILLNIEHPYFIYFLILFLKNNIKFFTYNFKSFNEKLKMEIEREKPDLIILPSHFSNLKYNDNSIIKNYLFSNFLKLFLKKNELKIIQIGFECSIKEEGEDINVKLINPFYETLLIEENRKYIIKNVCEFIYKKEFIEKKEVSHERINMLRNELTFYELILNYILQDKREQKEDVLFKSLLKELENISLNWNELNKIEIIKFLKLRIDLTKESLNLEKLNFKYLKKESKIKIIEKRKEFKINEFYKFKELNHSIINLIKLETIYEKYGNFKRCYFTIFESNLIEMKK
eukprot:gene9890-2212_t